MIIVTSGPHDAKSQPNVTIGKGLGAPEILLSLNRNKQQTLTDRRGVAEYFFPIPLSEKT